MPPHRSTPAIRVRECNQAPVNAQGDYVLYWMTAVRRLHHNFSLQVAVDWAVELKKPLVIFEPLRVDYPWASDRLHRFILDGMADNAAEIDRLKNPGVLYYPYVEPAPHAAKGLLAAFAKTACVIVTDDYPTFFLPQMIAAAARRLPVRLEKVDSNGLLPMWATERVFPSAFSFRSFLQKELPTHLDHFPKAHPLRAVHLPTMPKLPAEFQKRWPPVDPRLLDGDVELLARLPIDHSVPVVAERGGPVAARQRLIGFFENALDRYAESANQPADDCRSGLSPHLHFGHISVFEIFHELANRENWSTDKLTKPGGGRREGWWHMSAGAETWLDELVTWRELGFNMTSHSDNYNRYDSLPDWARTTLEKHARDTRDFVYTLDEFTAADTHDPVWNTAQRQLVREGCIHNYMRMLWGKKILEWTASPREALDIMIELNNRYALDGRDPNSYSGIFWCLGRYDRAWGPERPIFGAVRYMSSENTLRKLKLAPYLEKYGQ